MTHVLRFFILRLRLRPTAKGRTFSGPNIGLRPKVKIEPTVQHWLFASSLSGDLLVNPLEKKLTTLTSLVTFVPCLYGSSLNKGCCYLDKLPLSKSNLAPEIVFPHCESKFETPCHPRRCQKCKLKSLQSSASLSLIMTFFSSNTITYDVYPPPSQQKKIKKPP